MSGHRICITGRGVKRNGLAVSKVLGRRKSAEYDMPSFLARTYHATLLF